MDWKSSGPDKGGGGGGGGTREGGGRGGGGAAFCVERLLFLLFPLERFDDRVSSYGGGG